ncbi:MAG: rRNA maturation RNase YbeY [Candidatus Paceibacterota bacterium]
MNIIAEYPASHLTLSSTLKSNPATSDVAGLRFDYAAIKDTILGTEYECSLAFIGTKRSRTINRTFRGKDKPTDVLSFSYTNTSGEIFICPEIARTKATEFDRDLTRFLAFLFIHGCFHLKGMRHGGRMEASEARIRRRFQI